MPPSILFFLGHPSVGKGTQSKKICEKYGFIHISAGDVLREESSQPDSKYTEEINSIISRGQIVPSRITVPLIEKKMIKLGFDKKYIIDGFPRSWENFMSWSNTFNKNVNIIGLLTMYADLENIVERLKKRLLVDGPSKRIDDNLDTLKIRHDYYNTETIQIVRVFQMFDKCEEIDGNGTIEEVWERVQQAVDRLIKNY